MRRRRFLYAGITLIALALYFVWTGRSEPIHVPDDVPVVALPLEATMKSLRSPGHDQFAFDLAVVDPYSHHTLNVSRLHHAVGGTNVTRSYSWEQPVVSPVEGTVIRASDGWPDRISLHLIRDTFAMVFSRPGLDPDDIRPFAGNYVIIRASNFFVFLAHLKEGSLEVDEGDVVARGDKVGRIGNSGLSLEPHLHFELFDSAENLLEAETVPFVIDEYERWTGNSWELMQLEPLGKGQVLRSVLRD